MRWTKKDHGWGKEDYRGKKKKIRMIIAPSKDEWYFYGGGYNSLANGYSYATLEEAQKEAEKWVDENYKTARLDN